MKPRLRAAGAEFNADGQRVLTASADRAAQLWNAITGKAIGRLMGHKGPTTSARFSPDGQRVVTASADHTARLWDAATGKAIGEPMKHDDGVTSAQFSADGQRVLTASADGTARLWDVPTISRDVPTISREDTAEALLLFADLAEASGGVALQTSGQAEILNVLAPEQVRAIREKIASNSHCHLQA
jgi:WD40 repeat protein